MGRLVNYKVNYFVALFQLPEIYNEMGKHYQQGRYP
jgi:hypothetical protein